jgi:HTH-type transcriptional repressor of NAD biosynthesis genes
MKKGLVFGKFLPFHKGHKAMIDFATSHCDQLIVLVCGSDVENIPTSIRANWLRKTYRKKSTIIIQEFNYKESELPNTSTSSRVVSQIWASKFREILPYIDILITSEKYGDYVAEYMNIQHVFFDEQRKKHNISSSMIRPNPMKYWNFIANSAKPYYQKKVVLLGTESTGKTTLSNALAQYFQAALVTEAGRDLIEESTTFSITDLKNVIHQHCDYIKKASKQNTPLIIMDTDVHITQSYAKHQLGDYLNIEETIYNSNKADLYLYLNNDVPFVQDNTRMSEAMRNELDLVHRKTLKDFNVNYHEIKGKWASRLNTAIQLIEELLNKR